MLPDSEETVHRRGNCTCFQAHLPTHGCAIHPTQLTKRLYRSRNKFGDVVKHTTNLRFSSSMMCLFRHKTLPKPAFSIPASFVAGAAAKCHWHTVFHEFKAPHTPTSRKRSKRFRLLPHQGCFWRKYCARNGYLHLVLALHPTI